MKKTISITLGGRVYLIEDDAYHVLDAYLTRLKTHFAPDGSVEELMADIEASIGDKFFEKRTEQKPAVTKEDVEEVIAVMGHVEEIDSDEVSKEEEVEKRLYRNSDDMVVAGVCSGLAAYLGITPVFVRIAFVLLTFLNGVGVVIYIILWMAIPLAQTSAQKLEMRGKPVNLAEIEELLKEKTHLVANEGKAAVARLKERHPSMLERILNIPILVIATVWSVAKRLFQVLIPVIGAIAGVCIILTSILGMMASLIMASMLLSYEQIPAIITNISLQDIASSPWYVAGIISAACVALIPLIFFLILGVTVLTCKNRFRFLSSGLLIAVWIGAATITALSAFRIGPAIHERVERTLQAETVTRDFDVKNIHAVKISGDMRLTIKQGETASMRLVGLREGIENIQVTSEDNLLTIGERTISERVCFFCIHRPIEGEVILPRLESIEASQVSRIIFDGFTNDLSLKSTNASMIQGTLLGQHVTTTVQNVGRVELSGNVNSLSLILQDAARVTADQIQANKVQVNQSDVSRVSLLGTATQLTAELKDASRLEAYDFVVDKGAIVTRDVSRAEVRAHESLAATSTQNSRIYYEDTGASTTIRVLRASEIRFQPE